MIAAIPNAWALSDATSFNPEQVQVQAQSIGVPVGTVIVWIKETIPDGWLECDGQKVNEVLYPELAALMSTTPNYKGRFLQGTDTNKKVGDKIEAGLPNISGWTNSPFIRTHDGRTSGAIRYYPQGVGWKIRYEGGGASWNQGLQINAALSNPIYGKSNTVQPPAVTVKYIIKAE